MADAHETAGPLSTQEDTSPPARRKWQRLTPALIARIVTLDAEDVSSTQIATITGVSERHVRNVLAQFRATTTAALVPLRAKAWEAAAYWADIARGVVKGDHKAAKDLLAAIKVIDQPDQVHQTVVIGIGSTPVSADPWPQDVVVEADPAVPHSQPPLLSEPSKSSQE